MKNSSNSFHLIEKYPPPKGKFKGGGVKTRASLTLQRLYNR